MAIAVLAETLQRASTSWLGARLAPTTPDAQRPSTIHNVSGTAVAKSRPAPRRFCKNKKIKFKKLWQSFLGILIQPGLA
jgi:hypothetical protein